MTYHRMGILRGRQKFRRRRSRKAAYEDRDLISLQQLKALKTVEHDCQPAQIGEAFSTCPSSREALNLPPRIWYGVLLGVLICALYSIGETRILSDSAQQLIISFAAVIGYQLLITLVNVRSLLTALGGRFSRYQLSKAFDRTPTFPENAPEVSENEGLSTAKAKSSTASDSPDHTDQDGVLPVKEKQEKNGRVSSASQRPSSVSPPNCQKNVSPTTYVLQCLLSSFSRALQIFGVYCVFWESGFAEMFVMVFVAVFFGEQVTAAVQAMIPSHFSPGENNSRLLVLVPTSSHSLQADFGTQTDAGLDILVNRTDDQPKKGSTNNEERAANKQMMLKVLDVGVDAFNRLVVPYFSEVQFPQHKHGYLTESTRLRQQPNQDQGEGKFCEGGSDKSGKPRMDREDEEDETSYHEQTIEFEGTQGIPLKEGAPPPSYDEVVPDEERRRHHLELVRTRGRPAPVFRLSPHMPNTGQFNFDPTDQVNDEEREGSSLQNEAGNGPTSNQHFKPSRKPHWLKALMDAPAVPEDDVESPSASIDQPSQNQQEMIEQNRVQVTGGNGNSGRRPGCDRQPDWLCRLRQRESTSRGMRGSQDAPALQLATTSQDTTSQVAATPQVTTTPQDAMTSQVATTSQDAIASQYLATSPVLSTCPALTTSQGAFQPPDVPNSHSPQVTISMQRELSQLNTDVQSESSSVKWSLVTDVLELLSDLPEQSPKLQAFMLAQYVLRKAEQLAVITERRIQMLAAEPTTDVLAEILRLRADLVNEVLEMKRNIEEQVSLMITGLADTSLDGRTRMLAEVLQQRVGFLAQYVGQRTSFMTQLTELEVDQPTRFNQDFIRPSSAHSGETLSRAQSVNDSSESSTSEGSEANFTDSETSIANSEGDITDAEAILTSDDSLGISDILEMPEAWDALMFSLFMVLRCQHDEVD